MNWRVAIGISCPLSIYVVVYFQSLALPYGIVGIGISSSILAGMVWGVAFRKDNL